MHLDLAALPDMTDAELEAEKQRLDAEVAKVREAMGYLQAEQDHRAAARDEARRQLAESSGQVLGPRGIEQPPEPAGA